jgi:hypothetical protein
VALKRRRGELISGINKLSRYIICSAVTKRQIFEFISSDVRPSNALKAFLFEDDYSFGILSIGYSLGMGQVAKVVPHSKAIFRITLQTRFSTRSRGRNRRR